MLHNSVKKRTHIAISYRGIKRRIAVAAGGVNYGEFKLVIVGVKLDEQINNLVNYLVGASHGTVNLVNYYDRLFAEGKSLFKHETGLRHATLKRVNEQKNRVDHLQNTFNLAAEIGVSGGVNDINFYVVIIKTGMLGKNSYSAFTFNVVGVHYSVFNVFILAEGARLFKKLVDDGCFTVVNVGNYGDISKSVLFQNFHFSLFSFKP